MALTRSTPFSVPELATRVAVTLGALAIYRLDVALPLPGLDVERLYERGVVLAIDRTSVFALGVMPMINALLLVEIARLISKRFNDWSAATPADARRINRWALVGALLMAAFQAYGLAGAFEGISGAGPEFRLTVVTTLVGGTALLAWLAALISQHGVGSGLWILLLAPYLAALPATILRYAEFVRSGVLSQNGAASILAYLLIAVASVAALGLVLARRGMPLERTLIWPVFIGAILAILLAAVPWAPLRIAALAAVIVAVSLAESRRAEPRSAAGGSSAAPVAAAAPVVLTALALAAVAVVPRLLAAQLNAPIPIDGIGITAAVGITLGAKSFLPRIEPDQEACQSPAPG
jgi:preprotein translocase subunit SecY